MRRPLRPVADGPIYHVINRGKAPRLGTGTAVPLDTVGCLGDGTIASETYNQPNVGYNLLGTTSSGQPDLDQFGRVADLIWSNYGSGKTVDGYGYVYNSQGDIAARQNLMDGNQDQAYAYNAWNRLVEVQNESTGAILEELSYDGLGRLIQTESNFTGQTPGTTTDYYYCGDQMLESVQAPASPQGGATATTTSFVWSPRYVNAPVQVQVTLATDSGGQWSAGSTTDYYFTSDANGNVTAMLSASGSVVEYYGGFGRVTAYTANAQGVWTPTGNAPNQYSFFFFGGMYLDPSTGLYYDNARWYNASTGTFMSRDPADSSPNLYGYCGDDPAGEVDPTGQSVYEANDEASPADGYVSPGPAPSGPFQAPPGNGLPTTPNGPTPTCGQQPGSQNLGDVPDGDNVVPVCFAAGTLVLMADGSTKPIERIQVGDKVRAASHEDPEGPVSDGEVVEVYNHEPRKLVEVRVGGEVIRCTPKHPFYVRGCGFTAAERLRPGDQLRTEDGEWVAIESVLKAGETEAVYNFHVAELHTYFVAVTGRTSVLVHNRSGQDDPSENGPASSGNGQGEPSHKAYTIEQILSQGWSPTPPQAASTAPHGLPLWMTQVNGVEYSGDTLGNVCRTYLYNGNSVTSQVQGEAIFRQYLASKDPAALDLQALYRAALNFRRTKPPLHAQNGDTYYVDHAGSYRAWFFMTRETDEWKLNDCGTQMLLAQRALGSTKQRSWSISRSVGESGHYGHENVLVLTPVGKNPMPKMVFDFYKSASSDSTDFPILTFTEYRDVYRAMPDPDEP